MGTNPQNYEAEKRGGRSANFNHEGKIAYYIEELVDVASDNANFPDYQEKKRLVVTEEDWVVKPPEWTAEDKEDYREATGFYTNGVIH